jgi:hypothetical protein
MGKYGRKLGDLVKNDGKLGFYMVKNDLET